MAKMNRRDLMKTLIGISAAAACVTLQENKKTDTSMAFQDKHYPRGRFLYSDHWPDDVGLSSITSVHRGVATGHRGIPGHQS